MRVQEVPSQAGQKLTLQIFPVSMGVPGQMILHEPQPFRKQWVLFLLFNSDPTLKEADGRWVRWLSE